MMYITLSKAEPYLDREVYIDPGYDEDGWYIEKIYSVYWKRENGHPVWFIDRDITDIVRRFCDIYGDRLWIELTETLQNELS